DLKCGKAPSGDRLTTSTRAPWTVGKRLGAQPGNRRGRRGLMGRIDSPYARIHRRRGSAMPRLNYLAIVSEDPASLKNWYRQWFGFEEYNGTSDGSLYISDGYFSIGLFRR